MRQIYTKYDGKCNDCGEKVLRGEQAFWQKGQGILCPECFYHHEELLIPIEDDGIFGGSIFNEQEPLGLQLSRVDRYGIYTSDGNRIGSTCGCIDFPCCGH